MKNAEEKIISICIVVHRRNIGDVIDILTERLLALQKQLFIKNELVEEHKNLHGEERRIEDLHESPQNRGKSFF